MVVNRDHPFPAAIAAGGPAASCFQEQVGGDQLMSRDDPDTRFYRVVCP